jgi:hypothetical protein
MSKVCTKCKSELDDAHFYARRNVCKRCICEYGKERYSNTVGYSNKSKVVKEIRKCVDCGTPSILKKPRQFTQPKETYRCKRCALKITNSKRVAVKEKWKCIGCGKESELTLLSKFKSHGVTKETYMCQSCSITKLWTNEDYRLKQDAAFAARSDNPEWQTMMTEKNKKLPLNPTWLNNVKAASQKLALDPVWLNKITLVNQSIEKRVRSSVTARDIPLEEWLKFANDDEYCDMWSDPLYKVRKRVRARFNNCCIICGKTFEQHGGKHMHVHHVYRNKDACCAGDRASWLFAALCDHCHGKYGKEGTDALKIREILAIEYGNKSILSLKEYNELYPEGSDGDKKWGSRNGR